MITETLNEKQHLVLVSDRWHVVHARWERNLTKAACFTRTVFSEHDDRATAVKSARALMDKIVAELAERPLALRDQIFVRKPGYQSLKRAHRLVRKSK